MNEGIQIAITIFSSVMVSSGFWAFVQKKSSFTDAKTKLLLGIAHDRIVTRGLSFLRRGWITKDEYQDYQTYLYEPYLSLGGNGLYVVGAHMVLLDFFHSCVLFVIND